MIEDHLSAVMKMTFGQTRFILFLTTGIIYALMHNAHNINAYKSEFL